MRIESVQLGFQYGGGRKDWQAERYRDLGDEIKTRHRWAWQVKIKDGKQESGQPTVGLTLDIGKSTTFIILLNPLTCCILSK